MPGYLGVGRVLGSADGRAGGGGGRTGGPGKPLSADVPRLAPLAVVLLPAFACRWSRRLSVVGAFVAALAIVIGPWAWRNQSQLGRPIAGTTHGGYTLLLGNNPSFYEYLRNGRWGRAWDAEAFFRDWRNRVEELGPADEPTVDRLAYQWARENIRRQPLAFLESSVVRVGCLWSPLPHRVADEEGMRRQVGPVGRLRPGIWWSTCWRRPAQLPCAGLVDRIRGTAGLGRRPTGLDAVDRVLALAVSRGRVIHRGARSIGARCGCVRP